MVATLATSAAATDNDAARVRARALGAEGSGAPDMTASARR